MARSAMGNVLGSSGTMSSALDYKERANQNAARDRRNRNPNTPDEQFVMPGQQQMQAQMQAGARRFQGQPMTFANMQKQGVARPAPPPPPQPTRGAYNQAQPRPQQQDLAAAMFARDEAMRMSNNMNASRFAQFQPGVGTQPPLLSQVQGALNQPPSFDAQQRDLIQRQIMQQMQQQAPQFGQTPPAIAGQAAEFNQRVQQAMNGMNQQQTAAVNTQVQTLPPPPIDGQIEPAVEVEPRDDNMPPGVDLSGFSPERQAAYRRARGLPPLEEETSSRVSTTPPILIDKSTLPPETPSLPAAPSAPTPPAPSLPERVSGALGGPGRRGPGRDKGRRGKGEEAATQPAQPPQTTQPAQPTAPAQAQPQPTAVGGTLQDMLLQQLTGLTESPSAYESEEIQQMREAQRADLEAQFSAQRQQIEEEMARRGLSASSIAAGRFGDLAGQQARALATMEAGLTEKAAEARQRGMESAIQGLSQAAGIEIQAKGLDLQSKKVQADIDAETKRLMQQDRSLDLQQARDIAQRNIAFADLRERAAQRVTNERLTIRELDQQNEQFAKTFGLSEREFTQRVKYEAEQIRLRDREIDETTANNMATEILQRDTLNQRVAEADAAAARENRQFESEQERWKWMTDWMLANAEAQGAPSGQNPYGGNQQPGSDYPNTPGYGDGGYDPEGIRRPS